MACMGCPKCGVATPYDCSEGFVYCPACGYVESYEGDQGEDEVVGVE